MRPATIDEPEVVQALRVEQPVDGFPRCDDGGEGNDDDDEQAGEVFGSAEAVGVAAGRDPAAEDERDPEWDRGEGVGEVVDRVRQEGHGAADQEDRELQKRGAEEEEETDLQRPNALGAGLQGVIDRIGGVMGVRDEQAIEEPFDPRRMRMPVLVSCP